MLYGYSSLAYFRSWVWLLVLDALGFASLVLRQATGPDWRTRNDCLLTELHYWRDEVDSTLSKTWLLLWIFWLHLR